MNYLTAMKLSLGAAIVGALILITAPFSSASYTDPTTPGAVSAEEYQGVGRWTVKSWVDVEFDKTGHALGKPWTADGKRYRMRYYPTVDGGVALVTFYHYISKRDGDYGWVLWSKRWCAPGFVCSVDAPVS